MDNKTFNKIFDELQNQEAQYTNDIQETTDLLQLRGLAVSLDEVKFVYGKYMTYCIERDLI
jgi:hypothetical protein